MIPEDPPPCPDISRQSLAWTTYRREPEGNTATAYTLELPSKSGLLEINKA